MIHNTPTPVQTVTIFLDTNIHLKGTVKNVDSVQNISVHFVPIEVKEILIFKVIF